jgi:hypothetical protein
VFSRRGAVEEAWVREELARPIPEPEVVEVKMEDQVKIESQEGVNGDGITTANGGRAGENGVDGGDFDLDNIE